MTIPSHQEFLKLETERLQREEEKSAAYQLKATLEQRIKDEQETKVLFEQVERALSEGERVFYDHWRNITVRSNVNALLKKHGWSIRMGREVQSYPHVFEREYTLKEG